MDQLRRLGSEGGVQLVALDEESVDGASEVASDEEIELGVGEKAVLRARVLEAVDRLLRLRDGIVRSGAVRGADDGIALLQVLGQHALYIMRGRVEARLDDRLDASLATTSATRSARPLSPAVVREMKTRGERDMRRVWIGKIGGAEAASIVFRASRVMTRHN